MKQLSTTLIALCALTLFGTDASAQSLELPTARQGYYIGGGTALNLNNNFRLEADNTGTLTGAGGHLRLGQMVTPWLGFGLQFGGGTANSKDFDTGFGGVMLDIQLVPFDHLALHFGAGAGGLSLTDLNSDENALEGTGGGFYGVGLSYDWFPFYESGSGGLSVTPNVQFQFLPGQIFEATVVVVALDFMWWTGLENNKLDLPDGEGYTEDE